MTDNAFMKEIDGLVAIYQADKDADTVIASVDGKDRLIPRKEWQNLPLWDGPFPGEVI
jgi:hypothetical protein